MLQVADVTVRRVVVHAVRRRAVVASRRRLVRLQADVVGQARRNARHRNHFLPLPKHTTTEYSVESGAYPRQVPPPKKKNRHAFYLEEAQQVPQVDK